MCIGQRFVVGGNSGDDDDGVWFFLCFKIKLLTVWREDYAEKKCRLGDQLAEKYLSKCRCIDEWKYDQNR